MLWLQEEGLSGWRISRVIDGRDQGTVTLPQGFRVPSGTKVRVGVFALLSALTLQLLSSSLLFPYSEIKSQLNAAVFSFRCTASSPRQTAVALMTSLSTLGNGASELTSPPN